MSEKEKFVQTTCRGCDGRFKSRPVAIWPPGEKGYSAEVECDGALYVFTHWVCKLGHPGFSWKTEKTMSRKDKLNAQKRLPECIKQDLKPKKSKNKDTGKVY